MSSLRHHAAEALATAFLSGDWHVRVMMARGDAAVGAGGEWLRALAFDVRQRWAEPPLHELDVVARYVDGHPAFQEAWRARRIPHRTPHFLALEPRMGPARWPVKALTTTRDLADWLGLDDAQLEWLADRKALQRDEPEGPLQHYHRRWLARGGRLPRLIEAPKQRLKAIQRSILEEILSVVPAHEAAHGFVRGRSVKTHAALHSGQGLVLRFDLESFFTWLQPARAFGLFRSLGYRREVATLLLGLCTTRTPWPMLRAAPVPTPYSAAQSAARFELDHRLAAWHLPQGAPTSPALANLTAWPLDVRLQAWAGRVGAVYSRYADDLVFSGASSLSVGGLTGAVRRICREEGFRVNEAKTRVMRKRRRQEVTGLVVNQGLSVSRELREALEARLFNLARGRRRPEDGPAQRLRAQLEGQVGWVAQVKPAHGPWLEELLARVDWAAMERAERPR
jgi:hypothetical protein